MKYCVYPSAPWATSIASRTRIAFCAAAEAPSLRNRIAANDRQPDERPHQRTVDPNHVGHDQLEARRLEIAAVGTGAGNDGAAMMASERRAQHDEPEFARWLSTRPAPGRRVARAVVEHDCVGHEDDRQQEVAGDERRVQIEQHRDAAEHDLADHPGDQAPRQPHEVVALGHTANRTENGGHDRNDDKPREQPVSRLDHLLVVAVVPLGDELALLALRPVRAAQTRSGEPHGGTGDDDDREQDQRGEGGAPVGGGRNPRQRHEKPMVGALRRVAETRQVDRYCPTRMSRVSAYVALTKPRIIELLLVTTLPTMVVAQRGLPPVWLMAVTMVGGSLAAGGANAINMVVDRDIDALMPRTKDRPLVTGAMTPTAALVFAIVLEIGAFALLWSAVNLLSAVLAVSATAFYVFVYTMWLKRTSTQNIVIGGAAGAVPVLVGWAAVQNQLGWAPFLLFAIIFAWTPPHFWALAIKYRDEYAAVDVPMMPSVASHKSTSRQITLYTVALWASRWSLPRSPTWASSMSATAVVLGGVFLWYSVALQRDGSTVRAMRLFHYSITYVTLLFAAMAVDQLVRGH